MDCTNSGAKRTKTSKKYCFVPQCQNTENKCPGKLFICVPDDKKRRALWFKACRRVESGLATKTRFYCCEDHFNLELDVENYVRWKLQNGNCNIRMQKNAVPSKFACQVGKRANECVDAAQRTSSLARAERNRKRSLVEESIVAHSITQSESEDDNVPAIDFSPEMSAPEQSLLTQDKSFQVNIVACHVRSKECQTDEVQKVDGSTATNFEYVLSKMKSIEIDTIFQEECDEDEVPGKSDNSDDDDFIPDKETDSLSSESCDSDSPDTFSACAFDQIKLSCLESTRFLNQHDSRAYLGIPKECFFLVEKIASRLNYRGRMLCSADVVCLILRKIRLDMPFKLIANEFGISTSQACNLFVCHVPKLARTLKHLIYWPTSESVKEHLPLAFRARFAGVTSIIDCMEIFIQKPTNALHQSLTWSEYKHANTSKYLISITPAGLVNFVSDGYGGRASDVMIVKESGFLDAIPYPTDVMADRGFKRVDIMLQQKQCSLIRPDSVEEGVKLSKEEVLHSKKIASLRIHVERAIRRIREFNMLSPYACTSCKVFDVLDNVIVIACALVNCQGPLVKI